MERNFERDLNGMAAEREHNLEEYYAYMAVRVLDGCGAGPCDGEPCVVCRQKRCPLHIICCIALKFSFSYLES